MKTLQELVNLLAHKNTPEWVVSQTVRDLCYSSHNNINYQTKSIADLLGAAREALEDDDEVKLAKLQEQIEYRETQQQVFEEVHAIAAATFKELTGSAWTPPSKKAFTNKNKTATREFFKQRNVG